MIRIISHVHTDKNGKRQISSVLIKAFVRLSAIKSLFNPYSYPYLYGLKRENGNLNRTGAYFCTVQYGKSEIQSVYFNFCFIFIQPVILCFVPSRIPSTGKANRATAPGTAGRHRSLQGRGWRQTLFPT